MLQLKVVEAPEGETSEGTTQIVGPGGATVGRTRDNTWTLTDTDSLLSRSHFEIRFADGCYHLLDTSTNGCFLNDAKSPVGRGNQAPLQDGDLIRLGNYRLLVSLDPGQAAQPLESARPVFLGEAAVPLESGPDLPGDPAIPGADVHGESELLPEPAAFAGIQAKPLGPGLFDSRNPPAAAASAPRRKDPKPDPVGAADWNATPGSPLQESPRQLDEPQPPGESGFLQVPLGPGPEVSPAAGFTPRRETPQAGSGDGFFPQVPVADSAPPPAADAAGGDGSIIPDDWWVEELGGQSSPAPAEPAPAAVAPPTPPPAPRAQPAVAPPVSKQGHGPAELPPLAVARTDASPVEPEPPAAASRQGLEGQLRQALAQVLGSHVDGLSTRDVITAIEEMAAITSLAAPRLMAALSSRSQFKDQMRLDQTMVRARDNNPLKFCSNAEEALQHMLLNNHPGLLRGRVAVEEAFKELATHQTALVGALQPALKETVDRLSPRAIEAATESEGAGGFGLTKGKGKLWDNYREIYNRLAESEGAALERNFMNSLAQYYERSLNELK